MKKSLTVILPLYDRQMFTPRALENLASLLEFSSVIVADGSRETRFDPKNLPDYYADNIRFMNFPSDQNVNDFHRKIRDALTQADTDFVMLFDNDDLINVRGVLQALRFLRCNPSYISARGEIMKFILRGSGPYGILEDFAAPLNQNYSCRPLTGESPQARVLTAFKTGMVTNFYNIYRRNDFLQVFDTLCTHAFRTFDPIPELCFHILSSAQGNHFQSDEYIFLARQQATSLRDSNLQVIYSQEDHIHDLIFLRSLVETVFTQGSNVMDEEDAKGYVLSSCVEQTNEKIAQTVNYNRLKSQVGIDSTDNLLNIDAEQNRHSSVNENLKVLRAKFADESNVKTPRFAEAMYDLICYCS